MDSTWLEFEGASLAGIIWAAAAASLCLEFLRYLLVGSRPASRAARASLAAIGVVLLVLAAYFGVLRALTSSCVSGGFLLAMLATLWTLRSYRRTTRPISTSLARALIGLRIAAAATVLLILLQPVLAWVDVARERAVLGVLLDDSRSMTVRDVSRRDGGSVSRLDAIQKALRENGAALQQVEIGTEVRWYRFAADVQEAKAPVLAGEGTSTAIWDAVARTHALLAQSGRKIAGVVVVSDGRDNYSGPETAGVSEELGSAGIPLYAIGVGSEVPSGQTRRLQARRLDCPTRVPLFNRLSAQIELLAGGLAGKPIEIVLLDGAQVVDHRQVKPAGANEILRVELACTPVEAGLHRYTVRATTAELPEASLSQFVQVVQDRIRVLYLDRARYERASVARALEASKDLLVTKADASTGGKMPADTQYDAYDVVLIGDVHRAALGGQFIEGMAKLVLQKGHGLALLGGSRSFESAGWESKPLDEVLPVEIQARGELPAPIACVPTPAGGMHPICRLATEPQASDAVWKALPPLSGAMRLGEAKPAAEILLRSSYGEPLLVVQEAGRGRSAVVGIDATWQ